MRTFGEIEKELRISHGYTMEEVAEGTHTTKAAISRYESGTREPAFRLIRYFCEFYGVTADYLLGLVDDPQGKNGEQK
jgi:repressor LexA